MFKKKLYLTYFFVLFGLPLGVLAGEIKTNCSPNSYEELLKCAQSQSLEVQIINQKLDAASELEGVANQFVNPDLDVESIRKDADKSEISASLMFNFSIGGKRSAQKTEALAEKEKISAESDLALSEYRLNLMLKLYQLSHLKSEIHTEKESIGTFNKIISQFSKRSALTPEQEVSATIFKMAISDHQLSLTKLKNLRNEVLLDVARQTGLPLETILKNLPSKKGSWPDLDKAASDGHNSPHMKFANANLKLAKSQKEKAVAESWPDLKIGPVVKTQKDAATTENFAGFGLSMPLPIFSINGSGRAYQTKKVTEAELTLQNESNKIKSLRSQLADKYSNSVLSLKNTIDKKAVDEKHTKIERLFFSGLVSSSLVIEAHRQLFDLEEKRNETEREAIEALGQIYIIDNQFSGVIL